MLKIDYLDLDNHQVYFSSPMSSFRADYQVHEYKDVAVNGELETLITSIDVTVRNQCHVFVDTDGTKDGDIVLDTVLTDDMCREVSLLVSDMLERRNGILSTLNPTKPFYFVGKYGDVGHEEKLCGKKDGDGRGYPVFSTWNKENQNEKHTNAWFVFEKEAIDWAKKMNNQY